MSPAESQLIRNNRVNLINRRFGVRSGRSAISTVKPIKPTAESDQVKSLPLRHRSCDGNTRFHHWMVIYQMVTGFADQAFRATVTGAAVHRFRPVLSLNRYPGYSGKPTSQRRPGEWAGTLDRERGGPTEDYGISCSNIGKGRPAWRVPIGRGPSAGRAGSRYSGKVRNGHAR